jgi:hypothetical protein
MAKDGSLIDLGLYDSGGGEIDFNTGFWYNN